jgi:hypothetical protein
MKTTDIKPGTAVWVVWSPISGNWQLTRRVIKDVCTGAGLAYSPEDGDDCYVRWDRRGRWVKHDEVILTEDLAKAELAKRLRLEAAQLLARAEELDPAFSAANVDRPDWTCPIR